MRQGDDNIPILGTKKIQHLKENLGALDVKLSDGEDREIREAIQKAQVVGGTQ